MKYPWIDEYLLKKAGVTKDFQAEWKWIRYHIGGKMFAAVCLGDDNQPYYITLKLEPTEGDLLRQQYEDIIPGYYMNKVHWNSVKPDGEVPEELMKTMLDKAYSLVLGSLSKKKQREILYTSPCGTDCTTCGCFGELCSGCNQCEGKVFHAPKGEPCPIYGCVKCSKELSHCGECGSVPCEIWQKTRDPKYSDEEFQQNIADRLETLKNLLPKKQLDK